MDRTNEYREIARIVANSFIGELSKDEQRVLDAWLAGEGRREFYDSLRTRDPEERSRRLSHLNKFRNWRALRRRISPPQRAWLKPAAAAVCILLASGTFFLLRDRNAEIHKPQGVTIVLADGRSVELLPEASVKLAGSQGTIAHGEDNTLTIIAGDSAAVEYNTIIIPRGENYRLRLSDSSLVWLNAETRLRFPAAFGDDRREVFVEGEACFDVAHQHGRPFVVDAGAVRVEVLGTLFDISAYSSDAEIRTTLARGSVRTVDAVGRAVTLEPDEQAVFNRHTGVTEKRPVDAHAFLGWRDNLFVFRNETVEAIMKEFERWYDVRVVYDGETVKEQRFTANFDRSAQLTDILRMLGTVYNVEFSLRGGTVTVRMKS